MKPPLALLAALSLSIPLSAQAITGRVVDANGVGVPGVNINGFDTASGNEVTLLNDGTDAGGFFTTTVGTGPGVYDFEFLPPPPPATSHLAAMRVNQVVVTTTALGDVALPAGVALSGRTIRSGGVPVGGVELEVLDAATSQVVPVLGNTTDAFGNFLIAVPTAPIELRFRTAGITPLLAPTALEFDPAATPSLGDVLLLPGLTLQGTVRRTNGTGVASADMDVIDSLTGDKLFTPGDNTDANGLWSVVVPAGTYDIEACPRASDLLAGSEQLGVVVAANTNAGVLTLQGGVVLSGTIRDTLGNVLAGVDVDLRDPVTGLGVVLCGDDTNQAGNYAVVVPNGTFDVIFQPNGGCALGVGQQVIPGVVVSGNTTQNGVLPLAPTATASTFAGDGVNADVLVPVPVRLGAEWRAPLVLGHFHGTSGALSLHIRPNVVNGPTQTSSIGGRPIEVLVSGPLMRTVAGTHNGANGGITPVQIPVRFALLGRTWAAQYVVSGGGFVDLSRAVFGVVGCP